MTRLPSRADGERDPGDKDQDADQVMSDRVNGTHVAANFLYCEITNISQVFS